MNSSVKVACEAVDTAAHLVTGTGLASTTVFVSRLTAVLARLFEPDRSGKLMCLVGRFDEPDTRNLAFPHEGRLPAALPYPNENAGAA